MATGITPYSDALPDRTSNTPTEFATNVYNYQLWIDQNFTPELNISVESINTDVVTINGYKTDAYSSMVSAQDAERGAIDAKNAAFSAANYAGEWDPSVTYSAGEMVKYNGRFYRSLIDNNTNIAPDTDASSWELSSLVPFYKIATTDTSLVAGDFALCDTTNNAISLTLPSLPSDYNKVYVCDLKSTFDTNAVTVVRGDAAHTIMGVPEDMVVDAKNISIELMFVGGDWRLV